MSFSLFLFLFTLMFNDERNCVSIMHTFLSLPHDFFSTKTFCPQEIKKLHRNCLNAESTYFVARHDIRNDNMKRKKKPYAVV